MSIKQGKIPAGDEYKYLFGNILLGLVAHFFGVTEVFNELHNILGSGQDKSW